MRPAPAVAGSCPGSGCSACARCGYGSCTRTRAPAPRLLEAGTQIKCPMPGTILDVKVSVGDTVKQGDVLLVLEAMKMENEIQALSAGKVVGVHTAKGSAVNAGDLLLVIA